MSVFFYGYIGINYDYEKSLLIRMKESKYTKDILLKLIQRNLTRIMNLKKNYTSLKVRTLDPIMLIK